MVRARARGLGWAEISARLALSERQCRRVVAEFRETGPRLHEMDPVETIEEALEQFDSAIEDLALLAEKSQHDGVRLGATRSRLDALRGKLELMRAVGVLPRDLGRLKIEVDVRHTARAILDVFEAYSVPHEVQEAVVEAVENRKGSFSSVESIEHNNGTALHAV